MPKKVLAVVTALFVFILLASFLNPGGQFKANASFHTKDEIESFKLQLLNPIGPGEYFLSSAHCKGCHGFDSMMVANVDEDGNSVNLFDHWESTMMANSARDPLWRAKVSHEIQVNPAHAAALEDKCTSCHAPMGRYNAFFHGSTYGIADLANDSLGRDGVSCAACHTIGPASVLTYSGDIPYDTTRKIYGPFTNPLTGPMELYEGYTPVYSEHMNQSQQCASCHTLITESVDLSGNYTGGQFIEQATYHEYLNSDFPADSITCQSCHMPHEVDPIIIANGFSSLQPRYPYNQHVFVGGNAFMLKIIKDYRTQIGATAQDWQFDTTIANTIALLQERTLDFDLQLDSSVNDTGYFSVHLLNKTGHKFPSGYPSRRAVLQFVMTDAAGDTVFKSGTFDPDYRVIGENPAFEGHHDVISQQDIPQIYELVMGDVNGNFTSVLERSAIILKDDRIPPSGFTTTHYSYDTIIISNDALADPDFNKINAVEGSGADLVHYRVPLASADGNVTIHARVFYQAVPPKWVDEMFTFNSPEIDSFRIMFDNADHTPILVASDSIVSIPLSTLQAGNQHQLLVYPTVTHTGYVTLEPRNGLKVQHVAIFSSNGALVSESSFSGFRPTYSVLLPREKSVYFMKIQTSAGLFYRKVVRE